MNDILWLIGPVVVIWLVLKLFLHISDPRAALAGAHSGEEQASKIGVVTKRRRLSWKMFVQTARETRSF